MMFKWRRSSKTPQEPKTPKLSTIPLFPDERYAPISYHQQPYNPHSNYANVATPRQAMASMVDPWYSHREPTSTKPTNSRSRTVSTPSREVKAPTPVWPHPSQGRIIPNLDHSNGMRRANSTQAHLTPVAVPSAAFLEGAAQRKASEANPVGNKDASRKGAKRFDAKVTITPSKAFLEEQAEREQERREKAEREWAERELAKKQKHQSYENFAPISTLTPSKCQIEELRGRGVSEEVLAKMQRVPSKAYLEEQQEEKLAAQTPKRSSSMKPTLKSILKKGAFQDETKAYSEDESSRRGRDRRSAHQVPKVRPVTASVAPPTEEIPRGWPSRYVEPAIPAPVHEIHPSTFRPTHSTSTGSTDSAGHDYQRSRRASHTDTRFPASNYIRPYIREVPSELIHPPTPTHVDLSWPLVEYSQRRSRGQSLITFDAGFNPRYEKYAVRALKPGDYVSSPLSRQDSVMQLSETAFVTGIVITCDKLPLWPIKLKQTTNLRVIDVFRAIYDTYALPLTQEELLYFGKDAIGRCEAAFKQRCDDGPELACIAERKGMLRIDLLREVDPATTSCVSTMDHHDVLDLDLPRHLHFTPLDDLLRTFFYGRLIYLLPDLFVFSKLSSLVTLLSSVYRSFHLSSVCLLCMLTLLPTPLNYHSSFLHFFPFLPFPVVTLSEFALYASSCFRRSIPNTPMLNCNHDFNICSQKTLRTCLAEIFHKYDYRF